MVLIDTYIVEAIVQVHLNGLKRAIQTKYHIQNIMNKLDLRERHLLIVYALTGRRPD